MQVTIQTSIKKINNIPSDCLVLLHGMQDLFEVGARSPMDPPLENSNKIYKIISAAMHKNKGLIFYKNVFSDNTTGTAKVIHQTLIKKIK